MESLEKQLVSTFAESWNAVAPPLLNTSSTLKLLALREVSGDGMASALAVATTWSSAFAVSCSGALSGVFICLLKSDEVEEFERLIKQPTDGAPKPGSRNLVNQSLKQASSLLGETTPASFDESLYIDLALDEKRLAAIVGDSTWVGTFMLSVGDDVETQALLLYAPNGSLVPVTAASAVQATASAPAPPQPQPASAPQAASASTASRRSPQRRDETLPKNIDRLLDVELDVVVRFGVTNMPLRDVVRMGIGTMVELNRAIDEPVELLVNGRPLARGEVVVVDGYYGVRITEIGAPAERALSIL
jgi:flagellar motor switch protein FliN